MPLFDTHAISRAGSRATNMDAWYHESVGNVSIWIVADGLGGHYKSEVASATVVDSIMAGFRHEPAVSTELVSRLIADGHKAILALKKTKIELSQIATTVVVLISDGRRAVWGHVGDSRLYLFRAGSKEFQTKDDRVEQSGPDGDATKSLLYQAVGNKGQISTTVAGPHALAQGDAFVLCVDGFWEKLGDLEMSIDLAKSRTAEDWLVAMEARVGSRLDESSDNYTAVVARVQNPALSAPTRLAPKGQPPKVPPDPGRRIPPAIPQYAQLAAAAVLFVVLGFTIWRFLPLKQAPTTSTVSSGPSAAEVCASGWSAVANSTNQGRVEDFVATHAHCPQVLEAQRNLEQITAWAKAGDLGLSTQEGRKMLRDIRNRFGEKGLYAASIDGFLEPSPISGTGGAAGGRGPAVHEPCVELGPQLSGSKTLSEIAGIADSARRRGLAKPECQTIFADALRKATETAKDTQQRVSSEHASVPEGLRSAEWNRVRERLSDTRGLVRNANRMRDPNRWINLELEYKQLEDTIRSFASRAPVVTPPLTGESVRRPPAGPVRQAPPEEQKPGSKPEPQVEAQPGSKSDSQSESKPESQPESKPESKPEPSRTEAEKADVKPAPKEGKREPSPKNTPNTKVAKPAASRGHADATMVDCTQAVVPRGLFGSKLADIYGALDKYKSCGEKALWPLHLSAFNKVDNADKLAIHLKRDLPEPFRTAALAYKDKRFLDETIRPHKRDDDFPLCDASYRTAVDSFNRGRELLERTASNPSTLETNRPNALGFFQRSKNAFTEASQCYEKR